MRSFRRVTTRVAPALASVASVLLFATCDFDKISGTPTPITQQEIDRLFSITPTDTTILLGGTTTLNITPGTGVDLSGIAKEWTSSAPTVVSINSATGVATGVTIGNAIITARVLAPELDTGYSKTRALRVRYKALKACGATSAQCSPSTLDSIAGLNLSRPVNFFGTNSSDAIQTANLNATTTITTHDSGSTNATVTAMTSNNVFARKNGVAYVVGVFESMRDSIKVKVRQVAKSLTFPTTDYTANAINANRTLPIIMKDVNDSVMTASPRLRFRSSDTTVFTIDSITGVLRAKKKDSAIIFVSVDTILNKQQKLRVIQALGSFTKFAGDAVTDTVARAVTVLPTVTALDSGSTPISGVSVTFRLGTGGGSITDSVKITDANGRATLGGWTLGNSVATPNTVIATSGNVSTTFTQTGIPQRPYRVAFGQQPRSATTAASLTPAVTVSVRDSLNNLVPTATDSVFVAIGNNPSAATLSGTRRVAAVNGVATFSNLALNLTGSGYTLVATALNGLVSAISDAFDIFGAATKLAVIRQPVGTSAGAILDTIRIAVQDAGGNTVANDTRNVSIGIGTNPGSGTLSGTTTVAAVNGVATFTNLSINNAGVGYTLNVGAGTLTGATTNAFTITAVGAPAKLAFTTQPGNVASGATPSLAVTIQDANGATVTSSNATVAISLSGGTAGALLGGITSRAAVSGVATFPGISIDKVGTGYKFAATSSGLSPAESNTFNVTPGAATKLAFVSQPTHSVVSTTMSPSVTVAIQDANNNTVTSQAATAISLTIGTCTGATIGGTTSVNSASGVATFSALTVGATQATGCTLSATATGLATANSSAFNIVASTGAIRLAFGTQPVQTTAGSSIASFTVRAVDASGTTVTTAAPSITLSVLSGPGTIFTGSSTTASSGIATFSATQLRTAGTYKLLATATGFKPDSSNAFTIVAGSTSKLGFVNGPGNITAGDAFNPELSVAFQDQFSNTVTTQAGTIEVGIQNGPGGGAQVVGTRFQTAVNGVATFPGLTINKAFNGYTLFATNGGTFGTVSNSFNVAAGPLSALSFTQNPASSLGAGTAFSVTVSATDAAGNVISTFANPVTLALTGGDPSGTIIGTTQLTAASGTVTFAGLSVQKAATGYQLSASASGAPTGTSTAFNIVAGTATKLGWIDQVPNTFQNAPLNPASGGQQPRVAAQDQYGNTATHFSTIRITLIAPGGVSLFNNGFTQTSVDYTPTNGVVTLSGLSLTGTGTGIQLTASSPFAGLTSANSNSFNLSAFDVKSKLGFKVQPTNGTLAVAISPSVEVAIQDAYGNTVTTATDQVTIGKGTDPNGNTTLSGGAASAAVAGVAKFSLLTLDKVGSGYTLQATATGLTSSTSNSFVVTSPGAISGPSNIADQTLMGGQIYWLEAGASGSLKSVSVNGGTVTTYSTISISNAARITNDGTNLYWIEAGSGLNTGSVRRFNPTAGGSPTTLASSLSNVRTEANTFMTDTTKVYFIGVNAAGTNAALRAVTASGGLQTPTDLFSAAGTTNIHYFTVSGGNIYFLDASTGLIKRMSSAGGAATTLTSGVVTAQRMLLGGTTLYFTEGAGSVRTIANAPSIGVAVTPSTPVSGLSFIYDMLLDGVNLYMKTGSTVRRYVVTTFGGTASFTDLATNGQTDYESLLLDGTYIYYSNFSSGIGKVPK